MRQPKITVLIRTYNSEESISRTIISALKQTIESNIYEILIIDDGSTDKTISILNSCEATNHQIRIILREHLGPIKILNVGITESAGETIVLLDSDDEFIPHTLEMLWKAYKADKGDFIYSDYYEKGFSQEEKERIDVRGNIFHSIAAGILFKRDNLVEVGLYDEDLIFPEYDLLMKLEDAGLKGYYIDKPLYIYNRRFGSMTSDNSFVQKGKKQLQEKWSSTINIRDY